GPKSLVTRPAPITSAVPSTGSTAAVPGYGVCGPSWLQVTRISARPPHPAMAATGAGSRRHRLAERATRPPAASSQARVGSEKNAHGGDMWGHATANPNDATATAARTNTYGFPRDVRRPARRTSETRRTSHAVPMINAGHKR